MLIFPPFRNAVCGSEKNRFVDKIIGLVSLATAPDDLVEVILSDLCSFPANTPGQLNILRHDRNAFRMDGAEIGILE